jgi:hypothetical protein
MRTPPKSALGALVFVLCGGISPAIAKDAACKVMLEATYARMRVPHRVVINTTSPGRTPIHGQEVYLKTVRYQLLLGRWVKTSTSPQREIDGEKKLDARFSDCRKEGEGMVNGQPVAIYSAKTRNLAVVPFSGDLRMWISQRTRLPLRSDANASVPFLGQSRTVKVFSYDNVRAPASA